MNSDETINLAPGDELTVGPASGHVTIRVIVESESEPNLVIRDALLHRQEQIEKLRVRLAEIEGQQAVDSNRIADAIIEALRERLGW